MFCQQAPGQGRLSSNLSWPWGQNSCWPSDNFFQWDIPTTREGLTDSEQSYASDPSVISGEGLFHFTPMTEEQLRNVISRSKLTSARADPIPTKMVINCLDNFIPVSLMGPWFMYEQQIKLKPDSL